MSAYAIIGEKLEKVHVPEEVAHALFEQFMDVVNGTDQQGRILSRRRVTEAWIVHLDQITNRVVDLIYENTEESIQECMKLITDNKLKLTDHESVVLRSCLDVDDEIDLGLLVFLLENGADPTVNDHIMVYECLQSKMNLEVLSILERYNGKLHFHGTHRPAIPILRSAYETSHREVVSRLLEGDLPHEDLTGFISWIAQNARENQDLDDDELLIGWINTLNTALTKCIRPLAMMRSDLIAAIRARIPERMVLCFLTDDITFDQEQMKEAIRAACKSKLPTVLDRLIRMQKCELRSIPDLMALATDQSDQTVKSENRSIIEVLDGEMREVCAVLMSYGLDPDGESGEPLVNAIKGDMNGRVCVPVLRLLLERGTDVESIRPHIDQMNPVILSIIREYNTGF